MSGESQWPNWVVGYAWVVAATLMVNSVNVLSLLDERTSAGRPLAWWKPAVWEGTSGIAILAVAWAPMLMIARFPFEGPNRLRSTAAHLAATVPFSIAHVALMIFLRDVAYVWSGEPYEFPSGLSSFFYEYRKDFISYFVLAGVFWTVAKLRRNGAPARPPAPVSPDLVEIDEGQRLIRVPTSSVLCARSSGNYVEFFLTDGRRPIMRTALYRVEASLAGAGFVRTHRSWLANSAHVVEVVAEGSGDYGLTLSDGTEAPLSRRYPDALASLRGSRLASVK